MNDECYHFAVGQFECVAVQDGVFAASAKYFFANAASASLAKSLEAHNLQPGQITLPIHHLLVDTGKNLILVDTGMGPGNRPNAGFLPHNLESDGINLGKIDTVILSHCHTDHVGGLTDENGRLVFRNAHFIMSRREWEFWSCESNLIGLPDFQVQALRVNLPAIRDRLQLVDGDCQICEGIEVIGAPGHTPGHMIVKVSSGGEQLIHVVDTAVHPIHLEHPEWAISSEFAPRQAEASRRRVFAAAASTDKLVFGCHFPFPGVGHVAPLGEGWEWHGAQA